MSLLDGRYREERKVEELCTGGGPSSGIHLLLTFGAPLAWLMSTGVLLPVTGVTENNCLYVFFLLDLYKRLFYATKQI